MTDQIPLFKIQWDAEDIKNVVDSIGRGGYWAKGPYIEEFERRVAEYLDVSHAISVNSGTSALMAALAGADIGNGDEVIVPSFTQQATANSVEMVGADPVFADIERNTYGLDPAAVRGKITDDTAAIVPVHVYGGVCKIDEICDIANDHDLLVIEDAAEAMGATKEGQLAGTFGDVAALSFCENKIVPTGEGGMVLTNDEYIAEGAKLYRSHGRASSNYFSAHKSGRHTTVGGNFRMPDIVAALGCSQVERIEDLISGRQEAARRMNEAFKKTDGVSPHTVSGRHVYQFYTVTFDRDIDRDLIIEKLSDRNIFSKVYWDPVVHESEFYRERNGQQNLPVTEEISERVLSLPIHPDLSVHETDRIISAVKAAIDVCREGHTG